MRVQCGLQLRFHEVPGCAVSYALASWGGVWDVQTRTGIVSAIRVDRTAESPGPSLVSRASLLSMTKRVEEMQFEAVIPTPDPTRTEIPLLSVFEA